MKITNTIISLLKERDEETFRKFYQEYASLIYFIAAEFTKCKSDIEDITQDVFIKLLENIDKIEPKYQDFKPYVAKIAKNSAIDYMKKNYKKFIVFDDRLLINIEDSSRKEEEQFFNLFKEILTPFEFKVIVLRFIYGFKLSEMGTYFSTSPDKIKKASSSGLKKIEKYMRQNNF